MGGDDYEHSRSSVEVDVYSKNDGSTFVHISAGIWGVEDECVQDGDLTTTGSCTVAIHEGKSCSDASAIGGHLYDVITYPSSEHDPWRHGTQYYHGQLPKNPTTGWNGKGESSVKLAGCHGTPN